jgi:hypothetical protein
MNVRSDAMDVNEEQQLFALPPPILALLVLDQNLSLIRSNSKEGDRRI